MTDILWLLVVILLQVLSVTIVFGTAAWFRVQHQPEFILSLAHRK